MSYRSFGHDEEGGSSGPCWTPDRDDKPNPFANISAKAIVAERERIADEQRRAMEMCRLQGRNDLLSSSKLPELLAQIAGFFRNGGTRYHHTAKYTKELLSGYNATSANNHIYWQSAHETLIEGLRGAGFNVQEEDESDDIWVSL